MDILSNTTLVFVFCISILGLILIATVVEDDATKLLRDLHISKRLSPDECDLLRLSRGIHLSDGSLSILTGPNRDKASQLQRILLLDGRISAPEFEILHSSSRDPDTSDWRTIAKDKKITWCRSWKNHSRTNPVDRVFQIAELLEQILVYVPHQDLALNVPRTCRCFQNATKVSICLRHRLFLEPDYECSRQTPLPLKLRGRKFFLLPSPSAYTSYGSPASTKNQLFDRVLIKRLRAYPELQSVLIAQPPVHSVRLEFKYGESGRKRLFVVFSSTKHGVTVGDVLTKLDVIFNGLVEDSTMEDVKYCHVELKQQEFA